MVFPEYRPRRLRRTETFRAMIRETRLAPEQMIYPLFVLPGKGVREPVPSMPGVFRLSVDQLAAEARDCLALGVRSVLLFGLPEKKDGLGSGAYAKNGIVQQAIRELKNRTPEMTVVTDVCLCEYTDHGHCGCLAGEEVDNDATLELLAKTALSHAQAGADARNAAQDLQKLQTAAAAGNAKAQYDLGYLYVMGQGVPQDYAQAVKWFRKAAAQGNDVAQHTSGGMYERGLGGPKEYAMAAS